MRAFWLSLPWLALTGSAIALSEAESWWGSAIYGTACAVWFAFILRDIRR